MKVVLAMDWKFWHHPREALQFNAVVLTSLTFYPVCPRYCFDPRRAVNQPGRKLFRRVSSIDSLLRRLAKDGKSENIAAQAVRTTLRGAKS